MIGMAAPDAFGVAADLARLGAQAAARAPAVERHHAAAYRMDVVARAPRRTGAYVNTIGVDGNEVYSDHPAANRLENGFVGRDALGRMYNQPPRPHWSTPQESRAAEFERGIAALVDG